MMQYSTFQKNKRQKSFRSTKANSNQFASETMNDSNQKWKSYSYAQVPLKKQQPKWNQSVSTWRNSSYSYSFSKNKRFSVRVPYYTDIIETIIPDTKTNKYCTFGKGKRKPISQVVLRNAKQKPGPDHYDIKQIDQSTRKSSKGKSMGISWQNYEKVYLNHRKDVYSRHFTEQNPSAKYQIRQNPGKNKKKFTAYQRLAMYTKRMSDMKSHVPGPYHKVKDRHLYDMKGLNERNFSFGQRIDLSKPANDNPGAKYIIPGFCAKFENIKKKLEQNDQKQ